LPLLEKLRLASPAKYLHVLLLLGIAGSSLITETAQAADEDMFLGQIKASSEQAMGQGQTALWMLPLVATQYQPSLDNTVMQAALQAQNEGRFLDALIQLDEAAKAGEASAAVQTEINLLRASFLLQGNQYDQALEILNPLLSNPQHAADAYALTVMAYLQQGKTQQALDAAKHAQESQGGLLAHLALSYALQSTGRLTEAREAMHGFNSRSPLSSIALAREAELALTLDQVESAKTLVNQAKAADPTQVYVIAVSGLTYLIDGKTQAAKAAFTSALQRDSEDTKALLGLGLAEIKLGNFKAGLEQLQAANDSTPNNALILTYLGRAQQQSGQAELARASWRSAQRADPKDPAPWLYQAQAELQANNLLDARESVRQAQSRTAYRSVYRGEKLLREDAQLLQSNLAEIQRRMGLDNLAFHTLSDSPGEKNSANLRNQADLLQGQRFGESARRSLLLQSLFNDKPGSLPSELDVYGDGAGLTGAQAPQHGTVSILNSQQASYNNYDSLIAKRTTLVADAITGEQNTRGAQARAGVGSDTLGLSVAMRQYKTDGVGHPPNLLSNPGMLDNRSTQASLQWHPNQSTQAFVVYQTFHSLHGETTSPWDPINLGTFHQIEDNSSIVRLGLRQSLSDHSELRGLLSRQQTDQTDSNEYISYMLPYSNLSGLGPLLPFPQVTQYSSSNTHSAELQYRSADAGSTTQWGAQLYRGPYNYLTLNDFTSNVQQLYAARQQKLSLHWQLEAQLAWKKMDLRDNTGAGNDVYQNHWLPKLGLVYTPNEASHVRLAAWRDLNADTVGDATLAPATLAGMVIKLPGERNNLVQGLALGADRKLGFNWLLDGQTQQLTADQPGEQGNAFRKRIDQSKLALHWQPGTQPLAASLAYEYERVQAPLSNTALDSVQEQRLGSQQLRLRWFGGAQWTLNLEWSHNQVSASMQSSDASYNSILVPYQESFNQTDASVDWQFNKAGSLDVGVRNAGNRQFQYTSIDPLNPRFSNGRLGYARLKLLW